MLLQDPFLPDTVPPAARFMIKTRQTYSKCLAGSFYLKDYSAAVVSVLSASVAASVAGASVEAASELSAAEDSGAAELTWEEELFSFPPHAVRERAITKDKSKESVRFIRFIPFHHSLFIHNTPGKSGRFPGASGVCSCPGRCRRTGRSLSAGLSPPPAPSR